MRYLFSDMYYHRQVIYRVAEKIVTPGTDGIQMVIDRAAL
jgi:hypothetical protein